MRQSASLIKYSLLGAFVNTGTQAITMARQFQVSMARIQGLVGESSAQIDKYKKIVLNMGAETAKGPVELADALYFITSAGIKGAAALDILKQSARSAAAGLGETKVVADALTSIINAYGGSVYSASKANDILVATVREGKAEADTFAPALGKVLPIAAAFGASFEDVSAGVASLTRGGATAGTSAIYLRQVLSQLLKPSKAASEQLLSVGTSAAELRQKVQDDGLLSALEYLNARLGGNEYNVASEGLTKVFGNVRALTAVFSLLGPNLEKNREIFYQLNNATGDSAKAFDVYSQTADYKFKTAAANIQTALIGLGESIMPVATMLMDVVGVFAKIASAVMAPSQKLGALGKVLGYVVRFSMLAGAAFIFLARGGLFVFTRVSSLIRLFSNMQVVIKAATMGMRTHGAAVQGLGTRYGLLGVTEAEQIAIQEALRAEVALGTITDKKALEIVASTTTNKRLKSIATEAEALATGANTAATESETIAMIDATIATKVFGAAIMTTLPMVMAIGGAILAVASLFGMDLFGGMGDSSENAVKKIADLKEVLGGVVSLDKVDFNIKFNPMVQFVPNKNGMTDEEIKTLEKDVLEPAKLDKAIENTINRYGAGSSQAAMLAAAIVGRLGLKGEANTKLKAYLADAMSIDIADIEVIKFTGAGDTRTRTVISEQIASSLIGNKDIKFALKKRLEGVDFSDSAAVLDAMSQAFGSGNQGWMSDTNIGLKAIGDTMGTSFDQTGNLLTFSQGLDAVTRAIVASGNSSLDTSKSLNIFYGSAFKGLTELADFKYEGEGLYKIFGSEENRDAVIQTLTKVTGSTQVAFEMQKKLSDAYANMDSTTSAAEQYKVLADTILWATKQGDRFSAEQKNLGYAVQKTAMSVADLAATFDQGLSPEIQAIVDEFQGANKAMDFFKQGQDAIIDGARRLPDAEADFAKAVRGVGSAVKESGGEIGTIGEKQNSARESINDYVDSLVGLANAQALDPTKGLSVAEATITEGYSRILGVLTEGGKNTQEQAIKILKDAGLDNFGADLGKTLLGNIGGDTATEKTLLNRVAEGINIGAMNAAKDAAPGMKKFNEDLEKQILDFWSISSPSKKARDEIGLPIVKGLIDGLTGSSARGYVSGKIPQIAENIKKSLTSNLASGTTGTTVNIGGTTFGGGAPGMRMRVAPGNFRTKGNSGLGQFFGDENTSSKNGTSKKEPIYLKGQEEAQKKIEGWLEAMGRVSTAFTQKIQKIISDTGSALSNIGDFIDARLSLSNTINERQKLLIAQELYAANLAKAEREKTYQTVKAGKNRGADVTAYEVSRIEELQTAYESAARAYAMRRGTYGAMVDAQIALQEAQASSGEVSSDAVSAETNLLDAKEQLKNKDLELQKATLDIVVAQQKQVAAAINLQIHMEDARKSFNQFAYEAIPDVITSLDNLGLGLTEPNGVFMTSLHGLGKNIFDMIAVAAKESGLISAVPEMGPPEAAYFTGPTTPTTGGTGTAAAAAAATGPAAGAADSKSPNFGKQANGSYYSKFMAAVYAIHPNFDKLTRNGGKTEVADSKAAFPALYALYKSKNLAMAKGGIVNSPVQALLGESGPEAIIPLQGYSTRVALQKLFSVDQNISRGDAYGSGSNINITVNNPIAETAEESISRRMKALSTSGLFR